MLFVVVRIELAAERHLLVGEPADGLPSLCVPQFDVSIRLMTNDDWYMKKIISFNQRIQLNNIFTITSEIFKMTGMIFYGQMLQQLLPHCLKIDLI